MAFSTAGCSLHTTSCVSGLWTESTTPSWKGKWSCRGLPVNWWPASDRSTTVAFTYHLFEMLDCLPSSATSYLASKVDTYCHLCIQQRSWHLDVRQTPYPVWAPPSSQKKSQWDFIFYPLFQISWSKEDTGFHSHHRRFSPTDFRSLSVTCHHECCAWLKAHKLAVTTNKGKSRPCTGSF